MSMLSLKTYANEFPTSRGGNHFDSNANLSVDYLHDVKNSSGANESARELQSPASGACPSSWATPGDRRTPSSVESCLSDSETLAGTFATTTMGEGGGQSRPGAVGQAATSARRRQSESGFGERDLFVWPAARSKWSRAFGHEPSASPIRASRGFQKRATCKSSDQLVRFPISSCVSQG
uniref:Uncharacterized protein n=1 Tax=Trichuris muris TaxID=70415 RepID=A0A5S6Q855_TRIMR